ncbi:MAG: GNAT family N-acetyltransferase [Pseudomonadota bacterium]
MLGNSECSGIQIQSGGLDEPVVQQLLREHLRSMGDHSPPESIHALDLSALQHPNVSFWSVWREGDLLGCGALKELDRVHGEIKSMRTVEAYLRQGVAAAILEHIIDEGRCRGYQRLSLETGSADAFQPAQRLYAKYGFDYCDPFADYVDDPYSVFMTRTLK